MKTMILALSLFSTAAFAQEWTETFKLPEGMTYRARMAGYDCGKFTTKYVSAPENVRSTTLVFRQLAADKDLNKFLIEGEYPGTEGQICKIGLYLDRNRETKTLDFTHSLLGTAEGCDGQRSNIEALLTSAAYEPSPRGIRYLAVNVLTDTANDVCESGTVRAVFDRRLVPAK